MTIGFIGVGHLASAILSGMIKSGDYKASALALYDKITNLTPWKEKGATICSNEAEVISVSDIIFIVIRPGDFPETLQTIRQTAATEGKVFVSTAAGISTNYIAEGLGRPSKIVRTMPNTPIALGLGATAITSTPEVTPEELSAVCHIFETGGIVEMLPESLMNDIIAINGSSPAYVYLFADAMADAAAASGIDRDTAMRLILQTFRGSVAMMQQSGKEISTLIREVAVPGGTTIAALQAFEAGDFSGTVHRAIQACTDRANELAK